MATKREPYTFPKVPTVPGMPNVPKRSSLRDKFPGFAPDIPIPKPDPIPDYANRLAAWQVRFPAMSALEFIIIDYLTRKKGWRIGREFEYQSAIYGGRTKFGGFVVDFFVRPNLVLQPQGERWHLQAPEDRARLRLEAMMLTGRGLTVVYLWESDLLQRPDYTIELALRGQQLNTFRNDL